MEWDSGSGDWDTFYFLTQRLWDEFSRTFVIPTYSWNSSFSNLISRSHQQKHFLTERTSEGSVLHLDHLHRPHTIWTKAQKASFKEWEKLPCFFQNEKKYFYVQSKRVQLFWEATVRVAASTAARASPHCLAQSSKWQVLGAHQASVSVALRKTQQY